MRATCRSAVMVVSVASAAALAAWLAPSLAMALPIPPYQSSADTGAAIDAPRTLDRYGGGRAHPAPQVAVPQMQTVLPSRAAPSAAAPARYLGWSGKTAQQAPVSPQAQGAWASVARTALAPARERQTASAPPSVRANTPYADAAPSNAQAGPWRPYRQASAAPAVAPPQTDRSLSNDQAIPMPGPPVGGWRPYRPTEAARPAPTSIYDTSAAPAPQQSPPQQPAPQAALQPVSPAPQQMASAQPYKGGARFYSLHRDYGMTPDAIPIPPQFFGPTADLSSPPADPPLKRVTTSTGATRTQEIAGDDQGAQ